MAQIQSRGDFGLGAVSFARFTINGGKRTVRFDGGDREPLPARDRHESLFQFGTRRTAPPRSSSADSTGRPPPSVASDVLQSANSIAASSNPLKTCVCSYSPAENSKALTNILSSSARAGGLREPPQVSDGYRCPPIAALSSPMLTQFLHEPAIGRTDTVTGLFVSPKF